MYSFYSFAISTLDVVNVTPRPRFTPGKRTLSPPLCTHCTGDLVGPRAALDTEARGEMFFLLQGIEPRSPGRTVLSQTLYTVLPVAMYFTK
jgi:hypothetical protein